jgi:hypothetical protein
MERATLAVTTVLAFVTVVLGAQQSLTFEQTVQLSDRVIGGTVIGTSGVMQKLPNGTSVPLGLKISGLVFTPYRVQVNDCFFDVDDKCNAGEVEVLVPGGSVFETVKGESTLVTYDIVGIASAPLADGAKLVLFLQKYNGHYRPVNAISARLPIREATNSVHLRFSSPQFLSQEAVGAVNRFIAAHPSTPPTFEDDVPLDQLKGKIVAARTVQGVAKPVHP